MDQAALIAIWKCTLVNENNPSQYNAEQPTHYTSAVTVEELSQALMWVEFQGFDCLFLKRNC